MAKLTSKDLLSDGLTPHKRAGKVATLTKQVYLDILKTFDHPSNIKTDDLLHALQVEEQEIEQQNKAFAERFGRPIELKTASQDHEETYDELEQAA